MVKSKDELLKAIDGLEISDDAKIVLMEDIADSLEDIKVEDRSEEIAKLEEEVKDLKEKYKARFLSADEVKEEKVEEKEEDIDELKEEEIIDVKEI